MNERGEHVAPSDFEAHRRSYHVFGPCCLCPFQHEGKGVFEESAIYMAGHGRFAGEYVAACAKNECDYFGDTRLLHVRLTLSDNLNGQSSSNACMQNEEC